MTSDAQAETLSEDERARLLARPELILSDRDLMRALIGARETEIGENVIDIRGPRHAGAGNAAGPAGKHA